MVYKSYRLPLTEKMKETFLRGDVPRFSAVEDRRLAKATMNDPNFKQWFKKSAVIEKVDGEWIPLTMYHGTKWPAPKETFRKMAHFGTIAAANDRLENAFKPASGLSIAEELGIAIQGYAGMVGRSRL